MVTLFVGLCVTQSLAAVAFFATMFHLQQGPQRDGRVGEGSGAVAPEAEWGGLSYSGEVAQEDRQVIGSDNMIFLLFNVVLHALEHVKRDGQCTKYSSWHENLEIWLFVLSKRGRFSYRGHVVTTAAAAASPLLEPVT